MYLPLKKLTVPPFTDPPLSEEELSEIFSLLVLISKYTQQLSQKLSEMAKNSKIEQFEDIFLEEVWKYRIFLNYLKLTKYTTFQLPNFSVYPLYCLHHNSIIHLITQRALQRPKLSLLLKVCLFLCVSLDNFL